MHCSLRQRRRALQVLSEVRVPDPLMPDPLMPDPLVLHPRPPDPRPPDSHPPDASPDLPNTVAAPPSLGSFTRVRRIGKPGHSAVFLYRRSDPFVQQVAVRFLAAMPGEAARELSFRSLDHPNIVRLLDVQYTPEGRPCLVSEFVDGPDLAHFCAEQHLPRAARLRLLLAVADAVAFAHSRLTPHGDLRPAKILVNAAGEPRLLDFGLAALDPTPNQPHPAPPQPYPEPPQPHPSPHHKLPSPNQLHPSPDQPHPSPRDIAQAPRGGTIAGDIFDLGTTARALLGSTGDALSPQLAAVLAKACDPDPELRYGSVNELSADLRAALESRPVTACRQGPLEIARLWAQRNPAAGALLLALGLLVLAAAAGISVQTVRVLRGRRAAQFELHTLVATTGNLERSLYESLPAGEAADPARQALLAHIATTLGRLRADAAHDPALAAELAQQQRSLDHLLSTRRSPATPATPSQPR